MKKEINKIKSWSEYQKIFDKLIDLLKSEDKIDIIYEFKEAQKHVNGLTYGWYEFRLAFKKSLKAKKKYMTEEQNYIADFLLTTLNKLLTNK